MGIKIVYESSIFVSGWYENEEGLTPPSWFDRDLTSDIDDGSGGGGGGVIVILIVEPPFFVDPDEIFQPPPVSYEITAPFFVNENIIFVPMSIRALSAPDQMIRNEVRRRR